MEERSWQGVDLEGLAAHIDLYPTFVELAGAVLPEEVQEMDGRSLLSLLENPKAQWADRELFFHCGRWSPGKREAAKFEKCAVRTEQWRFVNNKELFDISQDPGEKNDVAAEHPEVVARLQKAYEAWWESVLPLMVNEGFSRVAPKEQPLTVRYFKQLKEKGIPDYVPQASKLTTP